MYFNAFEVHGTSVASDPDRLLFRKAAALVLDPSQNVNDPFCDATANVDKFELGGTPVLFITALHLAARLGDSSMCKEPM